MAQLVVQPSEIDSYIVDNLPNNNYGTSVSLGVGTRSISGVPRIQRVPIKFDYSPIVGETLTSDSKLELYVSNAVYANGGLFELHRLTQTAWTELGVTWLKYDGVNTWVLAGGDYASGGVEECTFTGPGNGVTGWLTIIGAALRSFLQNILDTQGGIAHIIIKQCVETPTDLVIFRSREYTADPTLQPKLTLDYGAAVAGRYMVPNKYW